MDEIRTTTRAMTDDVPVMLLPLRLETRFMTRHRPERLEMYGVLGRTMEAMVNLSVRFYTVPATVDASWFSTSQQMAYDLLMDLPNLGGLVKRHRDLLGKLAAELHTAVQTLVPESNPPGLLAPLRTTCDSILTVVQGIELIADVAADATRSYLDDFRRTADRLTNLSKGRIPYTNPKNKRDLYGFINSVMDQTEEQYQRNIWYAERIQKLDKGQLARIGELHSQIVSNYQTLHNVLAPIHPDDPTWASFVAQVQTRAQNAVQTLFNSFSERVWPLLEWLHNMHLADLAEITYTTGQLLIKTEKENRKNIENVAQIKKTRRKTIQNFESLRVSTARAISGTPEQLGSYQNLMSKASDALASLAQKTSAFTAKSNAHQNSVDTSVLFFTQKIPGAVESLGVGPSKDFVGSMANGLSFIFLNEIHEAVEHVLVRHMQGGSEDEVYQLLSQLADKFRTAADSGRVFTEAGLRELDSEVKRLENALHFNIRYRVQLTVIRTAFENFNAVVTDWKSDLFGRYHARPVFTEPGSISDELWVRIFPDNLAIHAHEPGLTEFELKHGKKYWKNRWIASGDKDLELGAWRALTALLGAHRAAWVARTLDPRSLAINSATWNLPPSADAIAVLNTLQQASNQLDRVKPNAAEAFDSYCNRLVNVNIVPQIQSVRTHFNGKPHEQVYLLDKVQSGIAQIGSGINRMVSHLNTAPANFKTTAVFNNAAQHIQSTISALEECLATVNTVKKLEIEVFSATLPEEPFLYPEVETKAGEYTQAATSPVLPARFVVATKTGAQIKHLVVGNVVPPDLAFGFAPTGDTTEEINWVETPDGDLLPEKGIRWMTDFEEAVSVGMGIIVPLTQEQRDNGFDSLFVLGVQDSSFDVSAANVQALFEGHHYSPHGMAFLPPGTPTNHTEGQASGWIKLDNDASLSHAVEMSDPLYGTAAPADDNARTDGWRLAKLLGIPTETFQHIHHAGRTDISNALAMHHLLYPGTMGYYLTEMWNTLLTTDNTKRVAGFFRGNVSARGIAPAVRIGRQPYGIMATTAFSRMRFSDAFDLNNLPSITVEQARNGTAPQDILQIRFDLRFHQFLLKAKQIFEGIALKNVKHLGNIGTNDPQKHFMEMLGLNATSNEHHVRFSANMSQRGKTAESENPLEIDPNALGGYKFVRDHFSQMLSDGVFAGSFDFGDEKLSKDSLEWLFSYWFRTDQQFKKAQVFKQKLLNKSYYLTADLVAPYAKTTDLLPPLQGQDKNYIDWLIDAMDRFHDFYRIFRGEEVAPEKYEFPAHNPFFFLLRQSIWETMTETALDILQKDGFFNERYRHKLVLPEYSLQRNNNRPANAYFMAMDRYSWLYKDLGHLNGVDNLNISGQPLFSHLAGDQFGKNMADYLLNQAGLFSSYPHASRHQLEMDELGRMKARMHHLKAQPVADLTRLFVEHLDVCSHRLDAWILGLANRRLTELRQTQPTGIYVGAYGWLTDLRPGPNRRETSNIPDSLKVPASQKPTFEDSENQGFIHAPSTSQAIAAAILRAGYRANQNQESGENLTNRFSVNLTSSRVRAALNLLEGVRNGNELAAMLGYQLERGLHEYYPAGEEMDQFILPLRMAYPLVVPINTVADGEQDNAARANVVNGLSILEEINQKIANENFPTGMLLYDLLTSRPNLVPERLTQIVQHKPAKLNALLREIDRMADSLDALGDLALSESVYQLVQGNHVRAAAVVSALAEGKPIPTPQIVDTPRTGAIVTHRVALHVAPKVNETPEGWPAELTPRAKAEPSFNYWLGTQMLHPKRVRCMVSCEVNGTAAAQEISLNDLDLQPLDVLFLLNLSGENAAAELESRLIGYFITQMPEATSIKINVQERSEDWSNEVLSFYEFEVLVKALRELVATATPLSAADLLQARDEYDRFNPGKQDDAELAVRAENLKVDLEKLQTSLSSWLEARADWKEAPPESAALGEAIELAREAAHFSIANAYPSLTMETSPKIMFMHLNTIAQSVKRLLDTIAPIWVKIKAPETKVKDRVSQSIEVIRTVFGKAFPVLPLFTPANFDALTTQVNLPATDHLLRYLSDSTEDLPMETWLQSLSPVRPAMFALESLGLLQETFSGEMLDMKPQQLPYRPGDYWTGMDIPATWQPAEDKLSIVSLNRGAFSNGTNCGLMIDEWVEVLPNNEETTSVAFHYDQPNAEPPQTILLAVTPHRTGQWEWDHLLQTLEETLDLVKVRCVEPDNIQTSELAHVLPALITEHEPPNSKNMEQLLKGFVTPWVKAMVLKNDG